MVRFSIGLLCAIAFVLILVILSGNHLDDSSGKAVGTATALAFLGLTGAAGSHLSRSRPELTLFGHLTLLAAVVAFLLTTVALWSEMDNSGEWAGCGLILAFACGHSCVLLAGSHERDPEAVRHVRTGTLVALWLLAILGVAEISRDGGDFDSRLLGVLAVLYILGSLLLPLLRRTDSSRPADPTAGPGLRVDHAVVAAGDRQRSEHFYASGLGATVEIAPEGRTVFVWPGSAESAINHLHARGIEIVEGPVARAGAEGVGVSVFCRDPDGGLVELISYG